MAQSSHTAAAVTHMDEADFTALIKLREELKTEASRKSVKLTYLPFIIKALVKTLKEYPSFNAVLDEAGGAIVRRKACNVGIAVSAEQGLVVPVIKGAENKDVWALAGEVGGLAEKVRSNKIAAAELQGGTFTITNIGPIGGLFATPIINLPEVAILGIMKISQRPVVLDHEIHIRDMANLVLTFDHRVNDGAEAASFMNTLIKHLENPRTLPPARAFFSRPKSSSSAPAPRATWAPSSSASSARKVLLVDKDKLGGECLNYGCIPSKALIHSAGQLYKAQKAAAQGFPSRAT